MTVYLVVESINLIIILIESCIKFCRDIIPQNTEINLSLSFDEFCLCINYIEQSYLKHD